MPVNCSVTMKGLGEKALQPARARHDPPVVRAEFFGAEQGDDFLELLVARDGPAHFLGDHIVVFTDDRADRAGPTSRSADQSRDRGPPPPYRATSTIEESR